MMACDALGTSISGEDELSWTADDHRHAGRDAFLEKVHAWVEEKGGIIKEQFKRVGASPDWSRQAYTMDPQCSKATLEAFLRLHAKDLIYRENRIINWDTRLQSAVSDIEVGLCPNSYLLGMLFNGERSLSRWILDASGRVHSF